MTRSGMSLIVKEVAKLVTGFIALFAAYIVLYGHLTPGGGFVGGVILACGFILTVLAYGKEFADRMISGAGAKAWDTFGASLFLAVALLGYAAGAFFANFLPHPGNFRLASAGTIPVSNVAIGIKISACLLGAFLALSVFLPDGGPDSSAGVPPASEKPSIRPDGGPEQ